MQFDFSTIIEGADCHIRGKAGTVSGQFVNNRPHRHYSMELHCIFHGEETIYIPAIDRSFRLTPGHILLVPQDTYHAVTTKEDSVERLCFNFSVKPTDTNSSPILTLFLNIREPILFENPNHAFFVNQCRSLYNAPETPLSKTNLGILLLSTLLQLLSSTSCAQLLQPPQDTKTAKQKWSVEAYIEDHYTDDTGIDSLADALGVSQRQARTLVRRHLGEDYKTIIIRRRMELAEFYLRDSDKSLEEIAWATGYHSYSGFHLCFKRFFGMTPSEKRQQLLGEK